MNTPPTPPSASPSPARLAGAAPAYNLAPDLAATRAPTNPASSTQLPPHSRGSLWRGAAAVASALLSAATLLLVSAPARAQTGLDTLNASTELPVVIFYPSSSTNVTQTRGPFAFQAALKGAPRAGNGRLVMFSHGSGGDSSPLAHLAQTLVEAGFVVAVPRHAGDHWQDTSATGPRSWVKRPAEISRAIDAVQADARFAQTLDFTQVGVFGSSAGGHTALVMAGGEWSLARFKAHCEANGAQDFPACVGLTATLKGDADDAGKLAAMRALQARALSSTETLAHFEPRVRAVVASVPVAAPFDLASLRTPRVPLAINESPLDAWLQPRFHSGAVRAACSNCTVIASPANAAHAALFSPWPQALAERITPLLVNPPNFDSAGLPKTYRAIAAFFERYLLPKP